MAKYTARKSREHEEDRFEITYGIDDGYVGGDRPQHTSIDADDFGPDTTEEDLKALFWEEIERHFREHCSTYSEQEDEFVAWAKEKQKAMAND
jgi:hypothetical protein